MALGFAFLAAASRAQPRRTRAGAGTDLKLRAWAVAAMGQVIASFQALADEAQRDGDANAVRVFSNDVGKLAWITNMIRDGHYAVAMSAADNMDTAVREEIPNLVWRDILGGELYHARDNAAADALRKQILGR